LLSARIYRNKSKRNSNFSEYDGRIARAVKVIERLGCFSSDGWLTDRENYRAASVGRAAQDRTPGRGRHHRAKGNISQVIRYAITTGRAERDPGPDLRGALPTPEKITLRASPTRPECQE
jgi:hypothetical protein